MSLRSSTAYQVTLWVLTLLCLGAAGYIAYLTFWGGSSPARLARSAEQAYQRGQAAEADKNWPKPKKSQKATTKPCWDD